MKTIDDISATFTVLHLGYGPLNCHPLSSVVPVVLKIGLSLESTF